LKLLRGNFFQCHVFSMRSGHVVKHGLDSLVKHGLDPISKTWTRLVKLMDPISKTWTRLVKHGLD
jgi:hypothetical protein